jgi:hypothetical protein
MYVLFLNATTVPQKSNTVIDVNTILILGRSGIAPL